MSNLIVDITELISWQGRLTGVPRVMSELASRFAAAGNCSFVVWDSQRQTFQATNFPPNDKNSTLQTARPGASIGLPLSSVLGVARKLRQQSVLIDKAMAGPARAVRKLKKSQQPTLSDRVVVPQDGDTLFVMADWHGSDQAFVDYLVSMNKTGVKLAQIAYDLLPIVTPQYSGHATNSLTRYTKTIYPLCDIVFAISQHTKSDITTWLNQHKLRVPPIEVIRLGDDFRLAKPRQPELKYFSSTPPPDFILCVGTIEARKNHALLYYAYKLAQQKNIALPTLVIVGRLGWKAENLYEIMTLDPAMKGQFIIMQRASDEELSWLYQHSLFSIYPSFYEGWGLPIAESIAHGIPCIASNTSSMPEIAGDLIGYFSPFSTDECLAAITAMLKPGAIAAAKRKIEAYRPASWDKTYDQVRNIIGDVYATKN